MKRTTAVLALLFSLLFPWQGWAGDEEGLVNHLADAATGRAARAGEWQRSVGMEHLLDGMGSQNIPVLALAVQLTRGVPDAEGKLLQLFERDRERFCGSEWRSSIYGYWTWLSISQVAKAAQERKMEKIYAAAMEWLTYRVALEDLLSVRRCGPSLVAGDRAAGHAPMPGWPELILARSFDCDLGRASQWLKSGGLAPKGKGLWSWEVAEANQGVLRDAAAPLRSGRSALDVLQSIGFRQQVGAWFVRTEGGAIIWRDANANGNTPPITASRWIAAGDRFESCPAGGGARRRQTFDHVASREDGGRVLVSSSLYGDCALEMPPGAVLQRVRIPGPREAWGASRPLPPPVAPPEPVEPAGTALVRELTDAVVALGIQDVDAAAIVGRLQVRDWQGAARLIEELAPRRVIANKNKPAAASLAQRIRLL